MPDHSCTDALERRVIALAKKKAAFARACAATVNVQNTHNINERYHDPLWCTPDTPSMENDAVATLMRMRAPAERPKQEKSTDTGAPKPARALPYIPQPQPSRR